MLKQKKNGEAKDGTKFKIGIVYSDYYEDITQGLLNGVQEVLNEWGVQEKNVEKVRVPGGWEIVLGCQRLLKKKKCDAIITLGCVLKGETKHDEYINNSLVYGLTRLQLDFSTPIAFGVLTPNSLEQAKVRSCGEMNRGREIATAALEMIEK